MQKTVKKCAFPLCMMASALMMTPTTSQAIMTAPPVCNQSITLSATTPYYELNLPSNLTTGFRWYLLPYNTQMIKISDYQYLPAKPTNPPRMGAAGHEHWRIELKPAAFAAPTILQLHLVKAQAWSLNHAVPHYTLCLATIPNDSQSHQAAGGNTAHNSPNSSQ